MIDDWRRFLEERGGRYTAHPEPAVEFDSARPAAESEEATVVALPHLAVMEAAGPDAPVFLQGQLCGEIEGLPVGGCRFTGWCNSKGRVITTLHLTRLADRVRLILPEVLREAVLKRLGIYVLRARVRLEDRSGEVACIGIRGRGAQGLLSGAGMDVPAADSAKATADAMAAGLPDFGISRLLVCGTVDALQSLWGHAPAVGTRRWRLDDVRSGIPWLAAETSEAFLPQELNLDELGGLSYTKGCYPGQEVVSRLRYRGRLKYRLCRVRAGAGDLPPAGTPLLAREQRAGTVLHAEPDEDGALLGLAVVAVEQISSPGLRIGGESGSTWVLEPLPRP